MYEQQVLVCWLEACRLGVGDLRCDSRLDGFQTKLPLKWQGWQGKSPFHAAGTKPNEGKGQEPRSPGLTRTVKALHALGLFSVLSWRFAHLATGLTRAICRPRPISGCVIYRSRHFGYDFSFSFLVFALLNSWKLLNCFLLGADPGLRCSLQTRVPAYIVRGTAIAVAAENIPPSPTS